jgi:hypothetical protein
MMNYNTTEQLQIALAYASVKANNETDTNEFLRFVNEMINTLSKKADNEIRKIDTGNSETKVDTDAIMA